MPLIGIDAGGTKTICQVANTRGEIVGESRGPGANLAARGPEGVEIVLRDVVAAATDIPFGQFEAVCVGMAGVDRPHEAAVVTTVLERLGQPANRSLVVNDALIALEAGAPD